MSDARDQYSALLLGGLGKLSSSYRSCGHRFRVSLNHYERGVPPSRHGTWGDWSLILLMVSRCSHPQRDRARQIAQAGKVPVEYLPQASLRCLAEALGKHFPPETT